MKDRRSFPEISPDALRAHDGEELVDSLWTRIRDDLPSGRSVRRGAVPWWIPAMSICLFGAGVLVGARFFAAEPLPAAPVAAEPARALQRDVISSSPAAGEAEVSSREPARRDRLVPARRSRRPVRPRPVPEAPAPEVTEPAAPPVVLGPPEWQRLADDGRYMEAVAEIAAQGGFDAVVGEATAEQLMLLVDVSRATGQRDRAILALRRIVRQHGSDPNASVAAWMLGNELVKSGDAEGAAQAFAMYRALSPNGDFAEDALAREFEVAVDQGDLHHARTLAEKYARDFPDGRRGDEVQSLLAKLERADAGIRGRRELEPVAGVEEGDAPPASAGADAGAAR